MNIVLSILKEFFRDKTPSLQEFIEAANPQDIFAIEYLEREYVRNYGR